MQDLQRIQPHCGQPLAAVYAKSLLMNLRNLYKQVFPLPQAEVFMALYDALACQNRWLDYSAEQYAAAHQLLQHFLIAEEQVTNAQVEDAILGLEESGFDTLPFGSALANG
ncbi:MAG: hypothetical protein AAGG51_05890 [Cyanobacteria bacterium P01_G01_bin.54]